MVILSGNAVGTGSQAGIDDILQIDESTRAAKAELPELLIRLIVEPATISKL
jgi:hypothetical protein